MRLIDADALKKKLFVFDMEFHDGHHQKYYVYKEKDVDDAPTIDAVPVIRCKDCKHYYFAGNRVPEEQSWVCDVWHVNQTAHMGYCFKAERRSDGTD